MGIGEDFQTFCGNLIIDNRSTISDRYKAITKRLNSDFWRCDSETLNSLYVGSYGRDTAIKGISDLDMVFLLPSDVYYQYDGYTTNGQSQLLQAVKNSIGQTYSRTDVGADGQVVDVTFSDGMIFEVVPCFENKAGTLTYPDSSNGGSWKTTNPRPEIAEINSVDKDCNNNLKRLCRMMRAWKSKWDVPMGGLLIDTFACRFIQSWQNRDKSFLYYDFMSRDFFEYLKNQDQNQSYWLAIGSGQYIYRRGIFEYKAQKCYNLSLEAIKDYDKYPYLARSEGDVSTIL